VAALGNRAQGGDVNRVSVAVAALAVVIFATAIVSFGTSASRWVSVALMAGAILTMLLALALRSKSRR